MPISSKINWPTAQHIKQQFLEDVELQCIDAGVAVPPMTRGTHWDLEATALANAVAILSANQQILDSDSNPLTAVGDKLDEWRQRLSLPEVTPSPGSGRLTVSCAGSGTIPKGLRFVAPNGMRGQTITSYSTSTGQLQIQAEMLDPGDDSNLLAGSIVRFESPPPNLYTSATVTSDFTGGASVERDERKRDRILNRLANPPGGGNWSQMREVALNSSGSVGGCYVYLALGGPGSAKITLLSATESTDRTLTSRAVVESAMADEFPREMWRLATGTVTNQPTDVALVADGPDWLASGPVHPSYVSAVASGTEFTISPISSSDRATGALVGDRIAYWSESKSRFHVATVLTSTPSGSDSALMVSAWSGDGSGPVLGEYVSPAFDGIEGFGAEWMRIMLRFGPGEMVADTDPRFQLVRRRPKPSGMFPSSLTSKQLTDLQEQFEIILNLEYRFVTSETPGTPSTIQDLPFCLCPGNFGVYPES